MCLLTKCKLDCEHNKDNNKGRCNKDNIVIDETGLCIYYDPRLTDEDLKYLGNDFGIKTTIDNSN